MPGPCILPASSDEVPIVAVALGKTGSRLQVEHSAILYRSSRGAVRSLEFDLEGRYTATAIETQRTRFAWAVPDYHERLLRQVAAYCESMSKSSSRFSYVFTFHGSVRLVENEGQFVIEGGTDGFTCATFVLAIFHSIGLRLVDTSDWHNELGDEQWQEETLEVIKRLIDRGRLNVSPESISRLATEIPCLRYPPHAVLGACRVGNHPTGCDEARSAGREALEWLDSVNKLLNRE